MDVAVTTRLKWTDAEKEYKRALELDPHFAEAHWCYAGFLDAMGRLQEGIRHHELQLEIDPGLDFAGPVPAIAPIRSAICRYAPSRQVTAVDNAMRSCCRLIWLH